MESIPLFLQGVFGFVGAGLSRPSLLDGSLVHTVSATKRAQLVYLRGGCSADALTCLTLMRDGKPMRLFPIGAKGAIHVALTVVEDLEPETKIEVYFAAPEGTSGEVVIDLGMLEI